MCIELGNTCCVDKKTAIDYDPVIILQHTCKCVFTFVVVARRCAHITYR